MQRTDSPSQAALAAEIRTAIVAFGEQNALGLPEAPLPGEVAPAIDLRWLALLRQQGWYVPHWPANLGGLAWEPQQVFVLQRECVAAGLPLPPLPLTHGLAGLLLAQLQQPGGSDWYVLCRRWLAGIADGTDQWAVAVDLRDPDWPLQAKGQGPAASTADAGPSSADTLWQLVPYPEQERWAVRIAARSEADGERGLEKTSVGGSQGSIPQVELAAGPQPRPIVSGLSLGEVEALLGPIQRMAGKAGARVGVVPDPSEWPGLLAPSAALAPRLRQLRALVDQDAGLLAQPLRLAALEVQLQGLQVMEARAVWPAQEQEGLIDQDFSATPSAMVAVQAARLGWAVAEIEQDVLGYFGLPVNDPMMQHNEGPIAPEPLANVAAQRPKQ